MSDYERLCAIMCAQLLAYLNTALAIGTKVRADYKVTAGDVTSSTRVPESGSLDHTTILITEFGLYELIFKSRMPAAVEFQNWVFWLIQKLRRSGEYAKLRVIKRYCQQL